MTEEQIKAMYEFDLEQYKSDRRYYSHSQSFIPDDFDEDEDDDADSRASRTSYVQRIGEYVEYEEIVEERDAGVYDPGTPVEPRITDAKFEEIG